MKINFPIICFNTIILHNDELDSASERTSDTLKYPSMKRSRNIYLSVTLPNFRSKDFSTANEKCFLLNDASLFCKRKKYLYRDSVSRHLFYASIAKSQENADKSEA